MLGTRALQIFDETTCVVRAVLRWTEFYKHESCGKCTPCREGTYWLVQILRRLEAGDGTEADLDKLLDICDNILGRSFCALGDGATSPITSSVQYFRDEYVRHFDRGRLPVRPRRVHRLRRSARLMTVTDAVTARRRRGRPRPRPRHRRRSTTSRSSVPKGTLVIRAAEQIGIAIPRFCDHPLLAPVGACRQCLVEVATPGPDGSLRAMPKPQAACTLEVTAGHGRPHPAHLAGRREGAGAA